MKLKEALDQVNGLSDEKVFFARRPWNQDSDAEMGSLDADFRVPAEIISRGLEYFLDVSVVLEVLEVVNGRKCSVEQRRELLIFYAENEFAKFAHGSISPMPSIDLMAVWFPERVVGRTAQ